MHVHTFMSRRELKYALGSFYSDCKGDIKVNQLERLSVIGRPAFNELVILIHVKMQTNYKHVKSCLAKYEPCGTPNWNELQDRETDSPYLC